MKSLVKMLVTTAAVTSPFILMAQKAPREIVPFSPNPSIFKEKVAKDLSLSPEPSTTYGFSKHGFTQQLPTIILDESNPVVHYNMPVVKPGNTSRILVAEIDPDFPYTYKMPVKKLDVVEK
ncbi:MAG: hypothetical protein V4721_08720 [Bacteroidota bacterium]